MALREVHVVDLFCEKRMWSIAIVRMLKFEYLIIYFLYLGTWCLSHGTLTGVFTIHRNEFSH